MGREEWSMTERKKICRDCYKELTESGARLGVCRNCAGKEVKKLRKRLIVSFLVGAALVGSVLAFRNHICSVYYFQKPGGSCFWRSASLRPSAPLYVSTIPHSATRQSWIC